MDRGFVYTYSPILIIFGVCFIVRREPGREWAVYITTPRAPLNGFRGQLGILNTQLHTSEVRMLRDSPT